MATASINKEYLLRVGGVGILMLAIGAWCLYDGFIGFPKVNREFPLIRPELIRFTENGFNAQKWLADDENGTYPLKQIFDKKGLKIPGRLVQELRTIPSPSNDSQEALIASCQATAKIFSHDIYNKRDLTVQYTLASIAFVFGAYILLTVNSRRKIRYEVDDEGLRGNGFGEQQLLWDEIESADWRKWEEKGIVTLYATNNRKFVLDGWHFAGIRAIADEIAKHFPKSEK